MKRTVYVLGAGVNKSIRIKYGVKAKKIEVSPPLAKDFFQVTFAMAHGRFECEYKTKFKELSLYIKEYWKKDLLELTTSDFDLEECFTLIELQLMDARQNNQKIKFNRLSLVEYQIKILLYKILSEFGELLDPFLWQSDPDRMKRHGDCEVFKRFGELLFREKPVILSFNYDDFIERIIESASKQSSKISTIEKFEEQVTDEELGNSYWNWNRALGYGIKFDETMMYDGGGGNKRKHFDSDRFYSHPSNKLYPWYLLKLHGSLNWFRYWSETPNPFLRHRPRERLRRFKEKESKILLHESGNWILRQPWLHDLYIDPIIITPILHKEKYFDDHLSRRLLVPIWDKAKHALKKCNRLVIIGYSFPPADFLTKKMFLESFSSNSLEELTVVNPSCQAARTASELCHFRNPIIFKNLEEYLKSQ